MKKHKFRRLVHWLTLKICPGCRYRERIIRFMEEEEIPCIMAMTDDDKARIRTGLKDSERIMRAGDA